MVRPQKTDILNMSMLETTGGRSSAGLVREFAAMTFACFLSIYAHAGETQIGCTLAGMANLCSSLPQGDQPYIDLPDGTEIRNPNHKHRRGDEPALTSAQKHRAETRIQERMTWVKEQMVDEIMAGRSMSDLDSNQKAWIIRIRNLRAVAKDCPGGTGGHLDAITATVEVCFRSGLSTDAQLTELLGHESGHIVDGCAFQQPYYRRNDILPSPPGALASDSRTTLQAMNKSQNMIFDFQSNLSQPQELTSLIAGWKSGGLITQLDSGMDASQFPLSPVLSCLVQEGLISKDAATVKSGEACRHGVVSETPSDMWGGRMMGRYLKEHLPATDLERLGVLTAESLEIMCGPKGGIKDQPALDSPKWDKQRPSKDRYINDRDRDEATVLSDPDVQTALRCQPDPARSCMSYFESAMQKWGRGPRSPVSSGPSKSGDSTQ